MSGTVDPELARESGPKMDVGSPLERVGRIGLAQGPNGLVEGAGGQARVGPPPRVRASYTLAATSGASESAMVHMVAMTWR